MTDTFLHDKIDGINIMRTNVYNPNTFFDKLIISYRTRKVMKLFEKKGVVYDFGCGNNTLIDHLNRSGYDAYGIDVEPGRRIICANLDKALPIESETANYIVSLANIEHLNEPELNMKEAFRILKPGGKLFLTTPSPRAKPILEFMVLAGMIVKEEVEDHKRYYSKTTLLKTLKQAGFRNLRIKYFQLSLNILAVATK